MFTKTLFLAAVGLFSTSVLVAQHEEHADAKGRVVRPRAVETRNRVRAEVRGFLERHPGLRKEFLAAADEDGDGKLSPSERERLRRLVQRRLRAARGIGGASQDGADGDGHRRGRREKVRDRVRDVRADVRERREDRRDRRHDRREKVRDRVRDVRADVREHRGDRHDRREKVRDRVRDVRADVRERRGDRRDRRHDRREKGRTKAKGKVRRRAHR